MNEALPVEPADAAGGPIVLELRAARLPVIGWMAWHYWLVICREGVVARWEVWQRPGAGGESWGHLHRNLLPPSSGVGGGASWVVQTWQGEAAARLSARVESSPRHYPFLHRYRYWPGPNSNTYVQWVLGRQFLLSWQGHGRRFSARDWA